jgi:hypothetical protein
MTSQQTITQFEDSDYAKYSVIKPPSDFHGDNEKYTRIVVDSRIRNKSLFPNPNDYEVPFDDDINDVIRAQLIYIDLPFSTYLINSSFNTIVINRGSSDGVATLSVGDYEINPFVTELQAAIDRVTVTPSIIVASYVARTDSFKFTSSSPFTFKFANKSNTLALLLGFADNKDYAAVNTGSGYELNAPFRRNFNFNNYTIMDIDQFDVLKSIDKDLNKTFAIIPKNADVLNMADDAQYIKRFSPPIPKLSKLRIHFYDRFGNKADFQNMDHRFELLLTSFKQKRKYGNIFAN